MKTALYRHFDAAGELLYVGISLSAVARLAAHKQTAHWFEDIARIDIEWLDTRGAALEAEALAIRDESPRWNIQHASVDRSWSADSVEPLTRYTGFAVLHLRSGRRDGNYFDESDAREQLAWWQSEYPDERFTLVVADCAARPELRTFNADEWRTVL